jgi:hypothetical protein
VSSGTNDAMERKAESCKAKNQKGRNQNKRAEPDKIKGKKKNER